jgi:transposase
MKNEGFSKRQIAEKLGFDFRTVSKYLAMTPEEFTEKVLIKERRSDLGLYESVVTGWIKQHPDISAAQVYDWLKEYYQVTVAERTARRFVGDLRKRCGLPKTKGAIRQYEAVEDPPMGRQMQVDLGESWVLDTYKRRHIKLYFVASVLSHSRYKWGAWYTRPLNAKQFVQALQACFEYLGGIPGELVFDQDRLLAVDENYGDIIFTNDFEQFRLSSGFEVYLCRKGDPETKGRTEATVKYFKGNFAKNRQFTGIDIWNDSFLDWLDRTGNVKVHETTKKIPAEVFEQERLFLRPVPSTNKVFEDIVTRDVHKNNTIFFEGNRYSVPFGTYSPSLRVSLKVDGNSLIISDLFGGYIIAEHKLSKNKGELVTNNNHRRDTSAKLNDLQAALLMQLKGVEDVEAFLTQIRRLKPRYTRDQFTLIEKTLNKHSQYAIEEALRYCLTHSLYSAVEFKNAAEYFEHQLESKREQMSQDPNVIVFETAAAVSKKRALSEYERALKGGES